MAVTYLDFAESDYRSFAALYNAGVREISMLPLAQGACEKYLKHIISSCRVPSDERTEKYIDNRLRHHDLRPLVSICCNNVGAYFRKNEISDILKADSWYYSARYPDDDMGPFELLPGDIEDCRSAIEAAREFALRSVRVFGVDEQGCMRPPEYER